MKKERLPIEKISGKAMKYFLTGGAGFIGSHLATALINRGDEVVVYDNLSTGRMANISQLIERPGFTFIEGNILDKERMELYLRECDHILHFAAAVGVFTIVEKPLESLKTNLQGTENVLELAAKYSLPFFLASTSEIYGKNISIPLHEESDRVLGSPLKARWSYSEAKAIDESLTTFYSAEKGVPVRIARFFNTVGPRQVGRYGMVVPRFISAAILGDPIEVYGDGLQSRAFCNVADAVRAVLLMLDSKSSIGEVFNVGNSEEITILELARRVISIVNSTSSITMVPYEQAYGAGFEDMQRRVPDISKLFRKFGWKPEIAIDQTITELAKVFRSGNSFPSNNNEAL